MSSKNMEIFGQTYTFYRNREIIFRMSGALKDVIFEVMSPKDTVGDKKVDQRQSYRRIVLTSTYPVYQILKLKTSVFRFLYGN